MEKQYSPRSDCSSWNSLDEEQSGQSATMTAIQLTVLTLLH